MIELHDLWVSDLGYITESKNCINFTDPGISSIHVRTYYAGPRTQTVKKADFARMVKLAAVTLAQTEPAAEIVFSPEKKGTLRFWVHYRGLNAVLVKD